MTSDSWHDAADTQMPKRRAGLIERALPEELILYDPETDRAFLLNHTGAAIWDLCFERHPTDQIGKQIACSFSARRGKMLEAVKATDEKF